MAHKLDHNCVIVGAQEGPMTHVMRVIAVVALVAAGAGPAAAQGVTLAGDMLKDWQQQKTTMVAISDAMPEDKWTFKSTPPQRSYGEQVMHVVQVNQRLLGALGPKTAAPSINLKATSKADVMQALRQSYDYGEAVFKEFDDAAWVQSVMGPAFIGQATRARIANFAMTHTMDIYGQMVVYLRLNGIVPPASRREN
jgi:uncharacterized damage-inducible protein DinB